MTSESHKNTEKKIWLHLPDPFSFKHCLDFLSRNSYESLHEVHPNKVIKLLKLNGQLYLTEIACEEKMMELRCLNRAWTTAAEKAATQYVTMLFDLDRDLTSFYLQMSEEPLMRDLTRKFRGLRMIGFPDLFEALCWSVIGQQINLSFAYRLKQRLVTTYGSKLFWKGKYYYTFPDPQTVSGISENEFRNWQYSASKTKYLQNVAQQMVAGSLNLESLQRMPTEAAISRLLEIKGIGPWSAHYVAMKCLRRPEAFPQQDVGLHNAIKLRTGASEKPSTKQLEKLGRKWHPWQGYATFYLWHTLIVS